MSWPSLETLPPVDLAHIGGLKPLEVPLFEGRIRGLDAKTWTLVDLEFSPPPIWTRPLNKALRQ